MTLLQQEQNTSTPGKTSRGTSMTHPCLQSEVRLSIHLDLYSACWKTPQTMLWACTTAWSIYTKVACYLTSDVNSLLGNRSIFEFFNRLISSATLNSSYCKEQGKIQHRDEKFYKKIGQFKYGMKHSRLWYNFWAYCIILYCIFASKEQCQ